MRTEEHTHGEGGVGDEFSGGNTALT